MSAFDSVAENSPRISDYCLSGVLTYLDEQWRSFQDEKDDLLRERNDLKKYIAKLEGERSAFEHIENALVARIKMLEEALKRERGLTAGTGNGTDTPLVDPVRERPKTNNNILEKYIQRFDSQSQNFMVQVQKDIVDGKFSRSPAAALVRSLEGPAEPRVKVTPAVAASDSTPNHDGRGRTADKPVPRVMTWVSKVKEGDTFGGFHLADGDDEEPSSAPAPKWQQKYKLRHHLGSVRSIAFHGEEAALLSGGDDGLVKLWSFPEDKASRRKAGSDINPVVTLRGHVGSVYKVLLDTESEKCISAGVDSAVRVWMLPSLDEEPYQERGRAIVYQYAVMNGHSDAVWDLAVHPTNTRVLSSSADGTIRIWDYESEDDSYLLRTITHPDGNAGGVPTSLKLLPWNAGLAVVGFSTGMIVFDIETGKCVARLDGTGVQMNSLDVHRHKHLAMSGHDDGSVNIWDLDSNLLLKDKTMKANPASVSSVAFDPQSDCVAIAGHDCSLVFGDVSGLPESGFTAVQHASAHKPIKMGEGILDVAYAPQKRLLASAGSDSIIRIWDSFTS